MTKQPLLFLIST